MVPQLRQNGYPGHSNQPIDDVSPGFCARHNLARPKQEVGDVRTLMANYLDYPAAREIDARTSTEIAITCDWVASYLIEMPA